MPFKHSVRLALCAMAALYWELVLIRWLGACVRIVAYYTNFVLIAAFFGLGFGALLARFPVKLHRLVFPALAVCVLAGLYFGQYGTMNPSDNSEYVWVGGPNGLQTQAAPQALVPLWLLLGCVYLLSAGVFAIFGQWLGGLFKGLPPLAAYSVEILGSILGILLFAAMAFLGLNPVAWMAVGFLLVAVTLALDAGTGAVDWLVAGACSAGVLLLVAPGVNEHLWSPYYKIKFEPITRIVETTSGKRVDFEQPVGYALTVNNDYHQMMLDLRKREGEHAFVTNWRNAYDAAYSMDAQLPPGPILIVGAGTGNDVMAAVRSTSREIYAVDIDPAILALGKAHHFEHPYDSPRVHVVVDDARSFFQHTDLRFAEVVFGFLDSHTLLSSFSSLRLDNFVYTKESMEQVKRLLLPGGQVTLTFASNRSWIHDRIGSLLAEVFDASTNHRSVEPPYYANGIVYRNFKAPLPASVRPKPAAEPDMTLPTDDWPFLYLQTPRIPSHYWLFLAVVVALGFAPLFTLPTAERRIRLPYFFLGAAFFLIETSNVVSLSLLYGSTWTVNVLVFTGILCLVLLGNLVSTRLRRAHLPAIMAVLAGSIGIAYAVPTAQLLRLDSAALRALCGVLVFLGPAFFASLIFALLIRDEQNLPQAYGSNILGAVVGGALEYLSMVFGFKFLLGITLLLYLLTFLLLQAAAPEGRRGGVG